jgi:hypothetical protein
MGLFYKYRAFGAAPLSTPQDFVNRSGDLLRHQQSQATMKNFASSGFADIHRDRRQVDNAGAPFTV